MRPFLAVLPDVQTAERRVSFKEKVNGSSAISAAVISRVSFLDKPNLRSPFHRALSSLGGTRSENCKLQPNQPFTLVAFEAWARVGTGTVHHGGAVRVPGVLPAAAVRHQNQRRCAAVPVQQLSTNFAGRFRPALVTKVQP